MRRCSYLIFLTLCLAGISISQPKDNKNKIQGTTVSFAARALQGFGMKVWLSNQMKSGLQAWDCNSQDCIPADWPKYGMLYPLTSNCEHLYVLCPFIGGIIDGRIYVDQGYSFNSGNSELVPEYRHILREHFWRTARLDSVGVPNRRYCDDDGDGLIDEDDLDGTDNDGDWNPSSDDVGADGLADPYEVSCDGIPYDPINNPDPAGDNFAPDDRDSCHANADGTFPFKNNRDRWTEKNGLPDHGEPHVDEDYAAVSDNDLYCSAIDTFTRPIIMNPVPMGIKCIQKSYAWDNESFDLVIPFDYYFINVGRKTINDAYVSFYADMDIGPIDCPNYLGLNYSGYMESLRTAYSHNPICRGSTPAGITLLGTSVKIDSPWIVWNWCDPGDYSCFGLDDDSLTYQWMNGDAFPGQWIFPDQVPTMPSDTRFLISIGPFRVFDPGDTIRVSIALVSGDDVIVGPNSLRENAKKAHDIYARSYNLPSKPLSPKLETIVGKHRVELKWYPHTSALNDGASTFDVWDDSNKLAQSYPDDHWRRINPPCADLVSGCAYHLCDENGKLPGGRIFSGFRLYRNEYDGNVNWPSRENFTLLREYLLPDTATEWSISQLDSVFIDSNLVREKSYWYAVTSVGLPNITVLPIPKPDGTVRYDTSYSVDNESYIGQNRIKVDIPLSISSEEAGKVLVVPNPYKVTEYYSSDYGGWEGPERDWNENKRLVKFIRLPKGEWTLRIFTLVGEKVTIIKNTMANGYEQGGKWMGSYRENRADISFDLLTESGRALASGVYIFLIDSEFGQQTGKFVLIR